MKNFVKKLVAVTMITLSVVLLVSCGKREFTVSFDSLGGSKVEDVLVKKNQLLVKPETDPTKTGYSFTKWYVSEEAAQSNNDADAYDFNLKVVDDFTLYAGWSEQVVLRLEARGHGDDKVLYLGKDGGRVSEEPTVNPKDGWKFAGWFTTKRGLTWQEPERVSFPYDVDKSETLFAYMEPVNSEKAKWSADQTYRSAITNTGRMILNPLTYENNLENSLIDNMATSLYSSEVDWVKAVEQGVADYPGDFTKIEAGDFLISALDYTTIKIGAAEFPKDANGDDFLDENGNYDRKAAASALSNEWTIKIRDDIYFQDGTQVTADTYEFTLKQFLSHEQNNYRATGYFKTEDNKNGHPIVNAYEYYAQKVARRDENGNVVRDENKKIIYDDATVTWEDVGFEVIDKYTFKITTHERISQAGAVSFGNIKLVHPAKYAASLDAQFNSTYGTPNNPYVSYGPYVLSSWEEDVKIIFNKNYDYVAKGTINYKSISYEIVENHDVTLSLYDSGAIDVIGINADNAAQFAEEDNLYTSFEGYPHFMVVNTAPSTATAQKHEHPTILYDKKFRQSLFFGLDRVYYTDVIDVPNVPSVIPVPSDGQMYIQDVRPYIESPNHLQNLKDLNLDPESYAYSRTRAIALFDEAYDAWIAAGNKGPVTLKMVASNNALVEKQTDYLKAHYEALYTKDGVKRLIIDVHNLASEQRSAQVASWNFDLQLGGIGFGGSTGLYWQYPAIAFLGSQVGGAQLGLSHPFTTDQETGERVIADYVYEVLEIELQSTYNYLLELGMDHLEDSGLDGHIKMLDWLSEEKDEEGKVTKAAGVLKKTVLDLGLYVITESDMPWDGTADEPFAGATADLWAITAAFEKVFLDEVTHIPTATSASKTLYSDKVVIDWPYYSFAFGWGANRYRYLKTDVDFQ